MGLKHRKGTDSISDMLFRFRIKLITKVDNAELDINMGKINFCPITE